MWEKLLGATKGKTWNKVDSSEEEVRIQKAEGCLVLVLYKSNSR